MLAAGCVRLALSRAALKGMTTNGSRMIEVGPMYLPVATMKATHGEKYPYMEPYPYEKKGYGFYKKLVDRTERRLNENSKVIAVEGNLGVGKHKFAERLASEFDLKVFPATPESVVFTVNGFDYRELSEVLPEGAKPYDMKSLFSDPHPERGLIGRLQLSWLRAKCSTYVQALAHLFHTGQGVVVVRSPFGDHVFAEAMREMGWLTKNYMPFYNEIREAVLAELLRPHLTIYLDAPVTTVKERLKGRNNPAEVGSRNLTDKYLMTLEHTYRMSHLPKMRESGEVVEIDWEVEGDDLDMDAIAEEIAEIKLEGEDNEDLKFQDWTRLNEDRMIAIRGSYGNDSRLDWFFGARYPHDCQEILYDPDSAEAIDKIIREHPAIKYQPGTAPEFGYNAMWKI
ncbi:hypothetical protein LSH36_436g01017 [Paralvinella palmiformis]|uniref:Deoxynucleoside kinase domain-containing protein n=1 Tax=Paralvinella palmiformis TaxID=53620 RepID=A0AAD9JBS8_9ANNE|nr:hypothetical protein LSH36_436g01017 [Paralvinella palmiformis]